jgi:hypothetical protein
MQKKLIMLALAASLLAPFNAQAAPPLKVVLEDSLWGAAIGTLAGAATLPFMKHPSDHYDRLAQGAGIGLIGGMVFGFCEISPVLYTYERPGHARVYCLSLTLPLH